MEKTRRKFLKRSAVGVAATAASVASLAALGKSCENSTRPLKGKVALVTGGARGIGRACVQKLSELGCHILVFDIAKQIESVPYAMGSEEDLHQTVELARKSGVDCLSYQGDVRSFANLNEAVGICIKNWGKIDFLINSAGICSWGHVTSLSDEIIRDTVDVNLIGSLNCVRAASGPMIQAKSGRIVLIASISGRVGVPMLAHYVASKWGTMGVVKGSALDLAPHGITVNAVCPTAVNTPMFRSQAQYKVLRPDLPSPTDADIAPIMMGWNALPLTWIEPEEVAQAVLFLVSESGRHMTGSAIDIAAGVNARSLG